MGIKAIATQVIMAFIGNIMETAKISRNTTRQTSKSWLVTKPRMVSTSEVHLWMILPVWFSMCHW